MGVSLQKGQKVSLKKDNAALTNMVVGLGWDEAAPAQKKGFFSSAGKPIDCDASAIFLKNGKLLSNNDLIYFGNLKHKSGAVTHLGDNLTGAGDGDDEQLLLDLTKVPADYDRIIVVVNIYQAQQRKQHFGMISNAFIRIVDSKTNQEMFKYSLTDDMSGMTAMIFGEIYNHNGEWKFTAMGQGTTDTDLGNLAKRYT